ncbi:unnamed protein product [Mucor hiemalis]
MFSCFYLMSIRYRCTDPKCGASFNAHDSDIIEQLPFELQVEFPAVSTRRGGISKAVADLLRPCTQNSVGPERLHKILRELHVLRHDRIELQYLLNELKKRMEFLSTSEWQSAMNEKNFFFIPSVMPTSNEEFCIYVMLSSIFINTKREPVRKSNNVKFKYTQSEKDYITKHIFLMDHLLSTDWDTTSLAVKEICQGYTAFRPGCLIITHNGVEVGTIEIKPLHSCKELVDVDVCRVAEICKRQLHLRMRVARSTKEFATFGIIVAGEHVFFQFVEIRHSSWDT